MTHPARPRIVIFGAGNIGRSFIAPVFTKGGYEAVFADVAPAVLQALSERDSYTLVTKSDAGDTEQRISPVRGVDARDAEAVKAELDGASLCATCVGAAALPAVLKTIAAAAADRTMSLDIILAENLKGAGVLARKAFADAGIPPGEVDRRLGIVETSIGKMVPIMPAEAGAADPLLCWAESFNTLIVDAGGFTGPVPELTDFTAVEPIAPWVARKLYIHNFGHAAAAYLGHAAHPEARYIWEVLDDPEVLRDVRDSMESSGRALRCEYPDVFTSQDINAHIDDLLQRFANRALGDTIYRVGRDLGRKLHKTDRVVGAISLVLKHRISPRPLLRVFKAALGFAAPGPSGGVDPGDRRIRDASTDPEAFIANVVRLVPGENGPLYEALLAELGKE